ncbi:hypothetical protein Godav_012977, partial [Gossypium davidsonii]|nr:hypothetical protein [Gossypium davidsonii]
MHVPLVLTAPLYNQMAFVSFQIQSKLMLPTLTIATINVGQRHLVLVTLLALPLLLKLIPVMDLVCTHLLKGMLYAC